LAHKPIRCCGNVPASRCLATDVTAVLLWLHTSGIQASCTISYSIYSIQSYLLYSIVFHSIAVYLLCSTVLNLLNITLFHSTLNYNIKFILWYCIPLFWLILFHLILSMLPKFQVSSTYLSVSVKWFHSLTCSMSFIFRPIISSSAVFKITYFLT
jgi:hypothetical protein